MAHPADYDLIATSDLGLLGHEIVTDFFAKDGVKMDNYTDCGLLIYDLKAQDVHCGGSGYGCFRRGDMGRHLVKCGIAAQVLWGISTLYRRHRAVSKIVEETDLLQIKFPKILSKKSYGELPNWQFSITFIMRKF